MRRCNDHFIFFLALRLPNYQPPISDGDLDFLPVGKCLIDLGYRIRRKIDFLFRHITSLSGETGRNRTFVPRFWRPGDFQLSLRPHSMPIFTAIDFSAQTLHRSIRGAIQYFRKEVEERKDGTQQERMEPSTTRYSYSILAYTTYHFFWPLSRVSFDIFRICAII